MGRLALLFLALVSLSLPLQAQGVRITLTDGRTVEGDYQGYANGRYRILEGGHPAVTEIEESRVQDVVLMGGLPIELLPVIPPPPVSVSPLEDARAAFERGDYEVALGKWAAAVDDIARMQKEVLELGQKIGRAWLMDLLEKRDAARLPDAFRKISETLAEEARRDLFKQLVERFMEQARAGSPEVSTLAIAECLSRMMDGKMMTEELKSPLADLLVELGDRRSQEKNHESALAFFRGALRVDAGRAEALKQQRTEAGLAIARLRLEKGDEQGAAEAAREVVELDPSSVEAKDIFEDLDFRRLKRDVDSVFGGEAAALLRGYLERAKNPERRHWAEKALEKLALLPQMRELETAAQMQKYFPMEVGRFMTYRKPDSDVLQKSKIDAVVREDETLKVYYTIQDLYRDSARSKTHQLEIEKDAVVLSSTSEREVLLKFPLRPGDAWTWKSRNQEFRREVKSLGETVEIHRGGKKETFTDCLVVEFTSRVNLGGAPGIITSRSTYAPGVGLVRREYQEPKHQEGNLEMVDYGVE